MKKDRASTANKITDKVIRMVSNFAVRCLFSLSLMKVSILAARLASIRINSVKMMICMNMILLS